MASISLRLFAGAAALAALALVAQPSLPGGPPASAATVTVTIATDPLPDAPDGCDINGCSLREAIIAAQPGDTIAFNIPGDGPHVIKPQKSLPALGIASLTLDGYTQPGASPNTAGPWQPGNANIQIVLDGSDIPPGDPEGEYGLWVSASGVTIRGLSIVNFGDEGIKTGTFPSSTVVRGNYIGVLPDGVTPAPNAIGVNIRSSQSGNFIGGLNPGDRNVISGNNGDGLWLNGTTAVVVAGNFIGTDASGSRAVPNGGYGIHLAGAPQSTVGGGTDAAGNLVSGNASSGVAITTTDGANVNVKGNRIGTAANGTDPLPNGEHGVFLDQGAHDNTIGGEFNVGEQNIIAFNANAGVALSASAGINNYIDPSVTHSNGGLGADLLEDGVTLNDEGDADAGPNGLQNFPVITSAIYDGQRLTVRATLNGPPKFYNVFTFANRECDPSGYGEGEHFLGSVGVQITGPGDRIFQRTFFSFEPGEQMVITMSASDPESSSEFSLCHPVKIMASNVNCDNSTDEVDAAAILAYLAGVQADNGPACRDIGSLIVDVPVGDVTCDNHVTAADPLRILLRKAGSELPGLPQDCPVPS